jgi:TolB protein
MGAGAWGGGPVWSPNGKLIAFESDRAGKPEIFTLTLATGKVTRVTSSKGSNVTPAISPDGKRIAFSSDRGGGDFDIYTVGLHGEDLIRVSNAPSNDYQPDWVS